MNTWGALWRSKNGLDGSHEHIMYDNGRPIMFRTRQLCRDFIKDKYGYIKTRKDLRCYPHGWRIPMPVKVKIEINYVKRNEGILNLGESCDFEAN